ncbi:MAG: hypothetical protein IJU25_00770, partial [Lachnospiraceae bacterium]|nr:hypothetical protein [Lachnospiraceae bacterium]
IMGEDDLNTSYDIRDKAKSIIADSRARYEIAKTNCQNTLVTAMEKAGSVRIPDHVLQSLHIKRRYFAAFGGIRHASCN